MALIQTLEDRWLKLAVAPNEMTGLMLHVHQLLCLNVHLQKVSRCFTKIPTEFVIFNPPQIA